MGRIIAIDYGKKRCGVAATDILKLSINPFETKATPELMPFLKAYCEVEEIECIVWGRPTHADGSDMVLFEEIQELSNQIRASTGIKQSFIDESFTSIEARRILSQMVGSKKKKEKGQTDKLSAVLILKRFLEANNIY